MTQSSLALDQAAAIIGAAFGFDVARDQIGSDNPVFDPDSKTGMVAALSEGQSQEIDYCIGATKPYEIEHAAAFEILVSAGDEAARKAKRHELLALAVAAIAANPSLNATVDFAEFESGDPTFAERYVGYAVTLRLTYTSADALG